MQDVASAGICNLRHHDTMPLHLPNNLVFFSFCFLSYLISFETLGRITPGAMQCLCEATHAIFPKTRASACRLLCQCERPAVGGTVPLPVSHASRRSGPPQRTHGLQLDRGRTAALPAGYAQDAPEQPRALLV
jgi:hypothetical protein